MRVAIVLVSPVVMDVAGYIISIKRFGTSAFDSTTIYQLNNIFVVVYYWYSVLHYVDITTLRYYSRIIQYECRQDLDAKTTTELHTILYTNAHKICTL